MEKQEHYDNVLSRFYRFYDGVIRSITLEYTGKTRHAEIRVACRDSASTRTEGWVCVRVVVRDIREFSVRERYRTSLQVLSQGIQIRTFGDSVGIEFGGALEPPSTIEDLMLSDAFVVGSEIEFNVGPY